MARPPRLQDIADRVGVSVSTVSRALSGRPGPGETLRAEILRVAQSMGAPDHGRKVASALRKATVILWRQFLLDSNNDYFNAVYDGVRREAAAHGIILETCLLDRDNPSVAEVPTMLAQAQGVLSLGIDGGPWRDWLAACNKPAVICSGRDREMRIDSVAPAWRDGARLATEHLIGLGHRAIAFVCTLDRTASRRRLEGVLDAFAEAGIPYDPTVNLIEIPDAGAETARAAFLGDMRARLDGITAAFCSPDSTAMGLISACLETGLAVPGALSVIGFDDMPTASLFHPGITTVHVDRTELGRAALRRLVARALHPDADQRHVEIGVRLVSRSSTGPAPLRP